ncbi:hypothetical protein ANN_18736 [Periplaneta americana]|uniref:Uncharacterized protein n=1 Tax=Periplaneta americana TaxID=6978 RepID=A0ABQ8SPL1_PERAM|nr:hypothetical protein ANN_18736 [Periplaneta americana]
MKIIGDDWKLYDLKSLLHILQKVTGIREMKRIFFKKDTSRSHRVVKERRLQELPLQYPISQEKKKDVLKLLQGSAGKNWQESEALGLGWYKSLLVATGDENVVEENDQSDCDCEEDDIGLNL